MKPVWLLIEEQADGEIRFALSTLPPWTSRITGYQQIKEKLGLDHHEGRSWQGVSITTSAW